jgi:hypothetical protein
MEKQTNGTEMVTQSLDLANVPPDGALDIGQVNPNDLVQAARKGDLLGMDIAGDPGSVAAVAMIEPQRWTPTDRKAIAARAAVKVASKIAQIQAQRLGFLTPADSKK